MQEGTAWRRSSYSGTNGAEGNCVEVAFTRTAVGVRDSKHTGPELAFSPGVWRAFLAGSR
jgi:hypothetical protein